MGGAELGPVSETLWWVAASSTCITKLSRTAHASPHASEHHQSRCLNSGVGSDHVSNTGCLSPTVVTLSHGRKSALLERLCAVGELAQTMTMSAAVQWLFDAQQTRSTLKTKLQDV